MKATKAHKLSIRSFARPETKKILKDIKFICKQGHFKMRTYSLDEKTITELNQMFGYNITKETSGACTISW